MADNTGDPHLVAVLSKALPYIPGIAGAVMSMAFGQNLKWHGKLGNFCVGMAFAQWGSPVIYDIGHAIAPAFFPSSIGGLLGFSCGFFGMALFGGLYQALAKYAGDPLKIIKFEDGPLRIGGDIRGEG